jgi:MOSC domain-containing protein YiiM
MKGQRKKVVNQGVVVGIYIAPARGAPTEYVEQAHVVPGLGIEGDRYFNSPGQSELPARSGRELTLIEIEAIETMCHQDEIRITPAETRRNIVTRGIRLNDLVGRVFSIGAVQLRGIRLCEPCKYLADQTDSRILVSMSHRGGLRTEILSDGIISVNDLIRDLNEENI